MSETALKIFVCTDTWWVLDYDDVSSIEYGWIDVNRALRYLAFYINFLLAKCLHVFGIDCVHLIVIKCFCKYCHMNCNKYIVQHSPLSNAHAFSANQFFLYIISFQCTKRFRNSILVLLESVSLSHSWCMISLSCIIIDRDK